jgi:hypothetical protein
VERDYVEKDFGQLRKASVGKGRWVIFSLSWNSPGKGSDESP